MNNNNALLQGMAIAFGTRNADIVPGAYESYFRQDQDWILTIQFADDVHSILCTKISSLAEVRDTMFRMQEQIGTYDVMAITLM